MSDEEGEAQEMASRSSNLTAANSEVGQQLTRSTIQASVRLRGTLACLQAEISDVVPVQRVCEHQC